MTGNGLAASQKAYETEANGWNLGNTEDASDFELTLDHYVTAEESYRNAREKLDSLLGKEETNRERRDAQEDFDSEKESLAKAYADLLSAVAENDQPLDEEQTALLSAIANLEVAREMQSRLNESNLDPEKLAAAEARLDAATAHVTAAEEAILSYELAAPFNGILLSLDLTVGETAIPTVPVAFLAHTSNWIVDTKDFAEINVADVPIGDPAIIKLDAFPGEEFAGTVTKIDPIRAVSPRQCAQRSAIGDRASSAEYRSALASAVRVVHRTLDIEFGFIQLPSRWCASSSCRRERA